jgi:hypothetical protein
MSFSVSTFALGPLLFVTVIAVAAAVLVVLRAGGPNQPATRPLRTDRARSSSRDVQRSLLMATADAERRAPRNVREWLADAFGWRGPEPVVTGDATRVPWWRKLRSGVLLLLLLALLGTALAAAVGALIFLAGFLLELATR